VFRAYLVPVDALRMPPGLEIESRAGRTLGLFGIVDYRAPSPLAYRELVWMPARVRVRRAGGKIARGFFVAKMLVDHEGSLAAGREVWALPKQLARFEIDEARVEVNGSDGSRVRVELGRRWPGVPSKSAVVTLQADGEDVVRFRGDMRGRVGPRRVRVDARELDGTWMGLERARPLGPMGVELARFETIMQPPERFAIDRRPP
jgi:hypothetical protein